MQNSDAGAFALTDIEPDAIALSERWDRRWRGAEPSGSSLRAVFPERWVRLYTLPEGRRPARTAGERAEVHARVAGVRAALAGADAAIVVGEDWDAADGAGGWTRRLLPGARPWRVATDGDAPSYFWVSEARDVAPLIDAVIDDRAALLFIDAGLDAIVAPYDGGIDVFLTDDTACEEVARRFAAWASPRADGL